MEYQFSRFTTARPITNLNNLRTLFLNSCHGILRCRSEWHSLQPHILPIFVLPPTFPPRRPHNNAIPCRLHHVPLLRSSLRQIPSLPILPRHATCFLTPATSTGYNRSHNTTATTNISILPSMKRPPRHDSADSSTPALNRHVPMYSTCGTLQTQCHAVVSNCTYTLIQFSLFHQFATKLSRRRQSNITIIILSFILLSLTLSASVSPIVTSFCLPSSMNTGESTWASVLFPRLEVYIIESEGATTPSMQSCKRLVSSLTGFIEPLSSEWPPASCSSPSTLFEFFSDAIEKGFFDCFDVADFGGEDFENYWDRLAFDVDEFSVTQSDGLALVKVECFKEIDFFGAGKSIDTITLSIRVWTRLSQ